MVDKAISKNSVPTGFIFASRRCSFGRLLAPCLQPTRCRTLVWRPQQEVPISHLKSPRHRLTDMISADQPRHRCGPVDDSSTVAAGAPGTQNQNIRRHWL